MLFNHRFKQGDTLSCNAFNFSMESVLFFSNNFLLFFFFQKYRDACLREYIDLLEGMTSFFACLSKRQWPVLIAIVRYMAILLKDSRELVLFLP